MSEVIFADPYFSVAGATRAVDVSKFVPVELAQRENYLSNLELGPELFDALCAAGTHTPESIYSLLSSKLRKFASLAESQVSNQEEFRMNLNNYLRNYSAKVFSNTLARGHIDVADMGTFLVTGINVPRLVTLFLCSPHYLTHEQQSLRYSEPSNFHLPKPLRDTRIEPIIRRTIGSAYELYKKMVEGGIPKEDARSALPLAVNSNITTSGGGREFTYLSVVRNSKFLQLPEVVHDSVTQIMASVTQVAPEVFRERGPNFDIRRYYPAPQIFVKHNRFVEEAVSLHKSEKVSLLGFQDGGLKLTKDQIAEGVKSADPSFFTNLLHVRITFLVKFSLEAAHQAVRHRTWNHDFESIYRAAERFDYMVPPKIASSDYVQEYHDIIAQLYDIYRLVKSEHGEQEAVIFLSNAHNLYDVIEIDGWNLVGNLPLRTCEKAQWEIRGIAKLMVNKLAWGEKEIDFTGSKTLSFYGLPPCHTFNTCFEDNTVDPCPIYVHKWGGAGIRGLPKEQVVNQNTT